MKMTSPGGTMDVVLGFWHFGSAGRKCFGGCFVKAAYNRHSKTPATTAAKGVQHSTPPGFARFPPFLCTFPVYLAKQFASSQSEMC